MKPSNMNHWSDTKFVIEGEITFSLHTRYAHLLSMGDMLAAVTLADRMRPWMHNGEAARFSIGEPKLTLADGEVEVYKLQFQSTCVLTPSQLPAYVMYTSLLAENAHVLIRNPTAVYWIGSVVNFKGTSIIYNSEQPARV